jgi:hypothetical protein
MIDKNLKNLKMKNIAFAVLFLSLVSCKPSKESTSTNASSQSTVAENIDAKPPQEQSPNSATNIAMNQEVKAGIETYRLVISLISFGAGTDQEAKHDIDQYIIDYRDKSGVLVAYANQGWGREGESDMMFTLSELTPEKQGEFVKGIREKLKGRELILIEENKKNRFNR